MGLEATINKSVSTAFDSLGDLIKRGELVRVIGVNYDPVTRAVTPQTDTTINVRVALVKTSTDDTKGDQRPAQRRSALVPACDLVAPPKVTDSLTVDGVTYTIDQIQTDPTAAIHRLELVAL